MKNKKLINSLKYAFTGIKSAFKSERNMKIHICIMIANFCEARSHDNKHSVFKFYVSYFYIVVIFIHIYTIPHFFKIGNIFAPFFEKTFIKIFNIISQSYFNLFYK